mgnify:CR=1 FL=1
MSMKQLFFFGVSQSYLAIRSPATVLEVGDVTPFIRSESYGSRLAASLGWQEDYEHHDKTKTTAFAGTNSSQNSGR